MTSLVFDFKDIASRMKGELKVKVELHPVDRITDRVILSRPHWRDLMKQLPCPKCHYSCINANGNVCRFCTGSGVQP